VFREPIFSPVAATNQNGPSPLNFNNTNTNHHGSGLPPDYPKMSAHDIDAQEALARDYNPALEVCQGENMRSDQRLMPPLQGPLVGEKRSSQAITEEYAKADPIYVAKTSVSICRCQLGLG